MTALASRHHAALAGPVVHLGILDRSIVVLSTVKAASDLLDKRSAIYSDRVRFPMLGELYVAAAV